jgi:hypothetical protein
METTNNDSQKVSESEAKPARFSEHGCHEPEQYYLASTVFLRSTRQGTVLLDLRHNKYYGVSKTDACRLDGIVNNWPETEVDINASGSSETLDSGDVRALLTSMLEAGVLQRTPPTLNELACSPISLDGSLASIGDEIIQKATATPAHLAAVAYSLSSAAFRLRCFSFESTVRRVSTRRTRARLDGYTFNLERVASLVFIFRRIRPLLFIADGHCLLHALTLVNFLAIYKEFPCWVLGVKTEPWGAHSWVQFDDYLLDTNPEKVCTYEPILAV